MYHSHPLTQSHLHSLPQPFTPYLPTLLSHCLFHSLTHFHTFFLTHYLPPPTHSLTNSLTHSAVSIPPSINQEGEALKTCPGSAERGSVHRTVRQVAPQPCYLLAVEGRKLQLLKQFSGFFLFSGLGGGGGGGGGWVIAVGGESEWGCTYMGLTYGGVVVRAVALHSWVS